MDGQIIILCVFSLTKRYFTQFLVIFSFFIAADTCFCDVVLSKCNTGEWNVVCNNLSNRDLSEKWLVIGNTTCQLKQKLSAAKKIFFATKRVRNGIEIFFSYDKIQFVSFLLPDRNKYAMFGTMLIHPGKKNIWISSAMPEFLLGVSWFGNPQTNYSPHIDHDTLICVWLEDENSGDADKIITYHTPDKQDLLKILSSPIKKNASIDEFMAYNGVYYMSPFLALKCLDIEQNCNDKKTLLDLQNNLIWNLHCFNAGLEDLIGVLNAYVRLLEFYRIHSHDNTKLQKFLIKRIHYGKQKIEYLNKLQFENGENIIFKAENLK